MFPSDAHRAKAMEDWLRKPTDSGKLGQNLDLGQDKYLTRRGRDAHMEGIRITAQTKRKDISSLEQLIGTAYKRN